LVNSYLAEGGAATGVRVGESYVDVGTLNGYRTAMTLLLGRPDTAVGAGRQQMIGKVPAVLASNGLPS
jgi:glucose-1-phosphate thymidylyltransferase